MKALDKPVLDAVLLILGEKAKVLIDVCVVGLQAPQETQNTPLVNKVIADTEQCRIGASNVGKWLSIWLSKPRDVRYIMDTPRGS